MFRSFFVGLFLLVAGCTLIAGCRTSTRKMKQPVFAEPLDTMAQGVYRIVVSQHVNVNGWEDSTKGKVSDLLEIQLFNSQHLPEDTSQLKTLGRSVASRVRYALKDTGEYDSYRVVFVKVDSGKVVTKKSWRAFIYTF
jgi:hypothetical protein